MNIRIGKQPPQTCVTFASHGSRILSAVNRMPVLLLPCMLARTVLLAPSTPPRLAGGSLGSRATSKSAGDFPPSFPKA